MKISRIFFLLWLLPLAGCLNAQEENIPVEPSERMLNRQHRPMELMDVIGLEKGMVVADIGAGRGRMTVFFASRVGEDGLVMANDINRDALEYLENRCARNQIHNVKTFTGSVDDPGLPDLSADLLFMVSTYHHLDRPVELMRNAIRALKPGGRLVIVERDPAKTGRPGSENTEEATVIRQMTEAGYSLLKVNRDFLENDNIYFFSGQE